MSLLAATIRLLTGDVRALDVAVVDGNGAHLTGFDSSRPANAAITTVAVSTTSAVLAAANAARRRLVISNTSGQTVFVAFAATATTAAYTVLIPKNGQWEGPLNDYTGAVSAILGSGSGNVVVTEITT